MHLRPKPITRIVLAFTAIAVFQCCCCVLPIRWRSRPRPFPSYVPPAVVQVERPEAEKEEESLQFYGLTKVSRALNSPDGENAWDSTPSITNFDWDDPMNPEEDGILGD